MSSVFKGIGTIASIAAMIPGPHQPFAAAAAAVANVGAALTAPKPIARGSISNVIIEAEPPRPYLIGETYFGGVLRHRAGYGDTLKKVKNPYYWEAVVYSGVGPVEALVEPQFDFESIGSYYTGFFQYDHQLGARPEAGPMVAPYGTPTGWGANARLSGCAAIGWNYKFDKDGKVFAGNLPVRGAIWKGEKCYDPRLDDTFDGGSGPHRLGDETTYTYSTNPALHAATYAYARWQDGKKVFGVGIPADGIDWATIAAWANDCDLNEWECHGVIFEGRGQSRVNNIDDIAVAGGGRRIMAGAVLSFDWHRPRVPLATITDSDLLESGIDIVAVQSHRNRFNTVVPQFRDPANNWELISAEPIASATYLAEDGEEKRQSWPLNMVKHDVQAGQLCTYAMLDSREIGPITVSLPAKWRFYRPGECLRIESELADLEADCVIMERNFDPVSLEVNLTLRTETDSKHDFAMGRTAVPPPSPIIGQTAQERDEVADGAINQRGSLRIVTREPVFPVTSGDSSIDIEAFVGTLDDGRVISFPLGELTGLDSGVLYSVFWDLIEEEYIAEPSPSEKLEDRAFVFVGNVVTSDGGIYPAPPTTPAGWNSSSEGTWNQEL